MTSGTQVTSSPPQSPEEMGGPPVSDTQMVAGPLGDSTPRFLTVAEVAAVMRVSKMTVYRLVHSGELASHRFGRSFRIPEPAVNAYLRGTVVVPGEPVP